MIFFNQHQKFTENFAQVAAVYFVDYEEKFFIGIFSGFFAELIKNPRPQLKTVCGGSPAHNKIFVGIILMKLHELNFVVVFFAENGICKPFSRKSFSHARRTLQDNIFLVFEEIDEQIIFFLADKNLR